MSGYLQRIAAGAVAARPRVHPFVDSRYAPVRREENVGPVVVGETRTVAAPKARVEAQERIETARVEAAPGAEVQRVVERLVAKPEGEVEPARRVVKEQTAVAREELKPLLPSKVEEPPVRSEAKVVQANDRKQERVVPLAKLPRGEAAAGTTGEGKAWSFQPLIVREESATKAEVAGAQPALMMPRREGQAVATQRQVARRTAAASGVVQRQAETRGDDIQIHIGRIEVTAVHPPAPRPAPAPARKTMSLDEYLRGNSGRA